MSEVHSIQQMRDYVRVHRSQFSDEILKRRMLVDGYHPRIVDFVFSPSSDRLSEDILFSYSARAFGNGDFVEAQIWLKAVLEIDPGHLKAKHILSKISPVLGVTSVNQFSEQALQKPSDKSPTSLLDFQANQLLNLNVQQQRHNYISEELSRDIYAELRLLRMELEEVRAKSNQSTRQDGQVVISDLNISFGSLVVILFKFGLAVIPASILLGVIYFVISMILMSFGMRL